MSHKPTDYPILYRKLCTLAAHRLAGSTEFKLAEARSEIRLLNHQLNPIVIKAIKHPEVVECPISYARYLASFDPAYQENQDQVKKWQSRMGRLRSVISEPLTPDQLAQGKDEVDRLLLAGEAIDIQHLSRQEQFHLWQFIPDAPQEWNYLDSDYNALVEPILGNLYLEDKEIAIVTRNSYGVACLNAYSTMFVDVDLDQTADDVSHESMPWGRTVDTQKDEIFEVLAEVATDHDLCFQCFQTKRGYRFLELSRTWNPTGIESQTILERLGCDRLYQSLCLNQQCYRARLEPKPWREGDTVCFDLGTVGEGSTCPESEVVRAFHQKCVGVGELA